MNLKRTILSLAVFTLLCGNAFSQTSKKEETPNGWHLMDKSKSGYAGISLDKAYDFVKKKKSTTVIVAVIDSGVDTLHEDLKAVLWHNPKEIPGNGKDDDGNGYIDDVYGWNFLGGKDGRNVKEDSYEMTRVYHHLKDKYDGKEIDEASLTPEEKYEYEEWTRAKAEMDASSGGDDMQLIFMKKIYESTVKSDEILKKAMGKDEFTGDELEAFKSDEPDVKKAKKLLLDIMGQNSMKDQTNKVFVEGFGEYVHGEEKKAEAKDKAPEDYRGEIVKDNYSDINDKYYGNADVMANTPFHGTHVSGIIAAARNNGKGMDGIADNVKIMMVRAVPDGDEHDKDIALAIRYAVDNGAKVINMSFGKSYSPEKKWVDEAVQYAASKGVLLVHAAGNDGKNVDETFNFPNPDFIESGKKATNWITVGASGDTSIPQMGEDGKKYRSLTASFSNYGKEGVDVFAPGMKIYSTVPGGNTYGNAQGTSMASPVVAGLAAFILSYYPDLSAEQVKAVIEQSSTKITDKVRKPGSAEDVELSEISKSGGIINAYDAIKLASTLKGERAKSKTLKPF